MREVTAKSILSQKNNINVYRGCTHGCIYCDSRSECYGMTYTFEDVEVKSNAAELLDKALAKKRSKITVMTGAMTDPYIPWEAERGMTRECLEVIARHGHGAAVLTKSDLVLRDVELLQRINAQAKCVVQMTLTTYDEELCEVVEPNVCTTKRRFEVLCELKKAGIPTVVWMTPILPFINDTEENVAGILDYCGQAEVKGILTFGIGMTLRYGNREYYYKKLDEHFPDLKRQYMRRYGSSYGIKSGNGRKLGGMVKKFCEGRGILHGTSEVFEYVTAPPIDRTQMSFFEGL